MMAKHDKFFTPAKDMNGEDTGSKHLVNSDSDDVWLYTAPTEGLQILQTTADTLVLSPTKPAPFHVPTL